MGGRAAGGHASARAPALAVHTYTRAVHPLPPAHRQAFAASGSLAGEFSACLRRAHEYIEQSQVRGLGPAPAVGLGWRLRMARRMHWEARIECIEQAGGQYRGGCGAC